jgi:hypothetical protein
MFQRDPPTPAPPCLFCGEPERAEIFEIWGHEFMLETAAKASTSKSWWR